MRATTLCCAKAGTCMTEFHLSQTQKGELTCSCISAARRETDGMALACADGGDAIKAENAALSATF